MRKFLLLIFLLPLVLNAQVVVTHPVAGFTNTGNNTSFTSASFTPPANSLIVVMVFATTTNPTTPAMSNSGTALTWTREASQVDAGNAYYIFWAQAVGTHAAMTITFTCTGDAAAGAQMSIHAFTNYNTHHPIRQAKINTSGSTNSTPSFSFAIAAEQQNGCVIGWSGARGANASMPPGGWTESDDLTYATPTTNFATARANGITTLGPFNFTSSGSTAWITMGFEVACVNRSMPLSMIEL